MSNNYSNQNDFMEIGDTNLVPLPDGWFTNRATGEMIDPNGCVFDREGHLIYDPVEEEHNPYDKEEYEWYDR